MTPRFTRRKHPDCRPLHRHLTYRVLLAILLAAVVVTPTILLMDQMPRVLLGIVVTAGIITAILPVYLSHIVSYWLRMAAAGLPTAVLIVNKVAG